MLQNRRSGGLLYSSVRARRYGMIRQTRTVVPNKYTVTKTHNLQHSDSNIISHGDYIKE